MTLKWEKVRLGDVAELQRGFDLPSTKRIEGEIPIVSSSGITGFHVEAKAKAPGVVTGRYGSIGDVFYLEQDFWPLNTSLWVKDFHGNDEKFIYFLLSNFDFKKFSDKTGVPGVNRNDLHAVNVLLPPLSEQKKIAQILSTWDKAISVTEKLLTNNQQQKKALMQQLLTGKKRLLDERGGRYGGEWHRAELGAVLDYMQPTPYLVDSTDYNDSYSIPVLTAGKSFILGYTNEEHGIYHAPLPAIIFDDFTTDSKFVDFEFKAKSSAMKILTAKKGVSAKYIFEAMQMLKFKIGGHQRHWISIYSNLVIPIPDAKEQQKIAAVLSAADAEISTLEKKLACLKDEKKALMQQLLTGKRRVKIDEAVAA
ncbi:TPA: restriction endonuclease subunit S [Escherichia coli]|nr:restriction endonuclease subunit S [Escherichia coli]HAW4653891.1 restriction endonuclease subunit S [Escherichia coli]